MAATGKYVRSPAVGTPGKGGKPGCISCQPRCRSCGNSCHGNTGNAYREAKLRGVELIKPERSIFDMAKKKHMLPTRAIRWCCDIYKEQGGAGKVTLTGIRRAESARRKRRNEAELSRYKFSGSFDQFSERKEEMVACVKGKDKVILSPILRWSDRHVWQFLNGNGIPHCSLYDEGNTRIGCILCPMSPYRQKIKEMRRWPHVKRNWLKTIRWLIDAGIINRNFDDPETGFKWWLSGKSFEGFYADEFLQGKLVFDR